MTICLTAASRTAFREHWSLGLTELTQSVWDDLAVGQSREGDLLILVSRFARALYGTNGWGQWLAEGLGWSGSCYALESTLDALSLTHRLLSDGAVRRVILLAADKASDASEAVLEDWRNRALHPDERQRGLTVDQAHGLMARAYLERFQLSETVLSAPPALAHAHAVVQSQAMFPFAIQPEAVPASPLVGDPLHLLHVSSLCDGAVGLVFENKSTVGEVVWRQVGEGRTALSLAGRVDLATDEATRQAMVGWDAASWNQVVSLELDDRYASSALLAVEALGLAEPGEGLKLFENTDWADRINRTGGHKAQGEAGAAADLRGLAESFDRLQGGSTGQLALIQLTENALSRAAVYQLEVRA